MSAKEREPSTLAISKQEESDQKVIEEIWRNGIAWEHPGGPTEKLSLLTLRAYDKEKGIYNLRLIKNLGTRMLRTREDLNSILVRFDIRKREGMLVEEKR